MTCFADATKSDTQKFAKFHRGMLERGIYLAPSQYEAPSQLGASPRQIALSLQRIRRPSFLRVFSWCCVSCPRRGVAASLPCSSDLRLSMDPAGVEARASDLRAATAAQSSAGESGALRPTQGTGMGRTRGVANGRFLASRYQCLSGRCATRWPEDGFVRSDVASLCTVGPGTWAAPPPTSRRCGCEMAAPLWWRLVQAIGATGEWRHIRTYWHRGAEDSVTSVLVPPASSALPPPIGSYVGCTATDASILDSSYASFFLSSFSCAPHRFPLLPLPLSMQGARPDLGLP